MTLTNQQYAHVICAAVPVPPEKREQFFERVRARLELLGSFDDADVATACKSATFGLLTGSVAVPVK